MICVPPGLNPSVQSRLVDNYPFITRLKVHGNSDQYLQNEQQSIQSGKVGLICQPVQGQDPDSKDNEKIDPATLINFINSQHF